MRPQARSSGTSFVADVVSVTVALGFIVALGAGLIRIGLSGFLATAFGALCAGAAVTLLLSATSANLLTYTVAAVLVRR